LTHRFGCRWRRRRQLVRAALEATAGAFHPVLTTLCQQTAAVGAGDVDWPVPSSEIACGVCAAAVEHSALLGAALHQLAAAARTFHAQLILNALGVPALREARAGQEASEPAEFDHHVPAALRAGLVGLLICNLDPLDRLSRLFDSLVEGLIEALEHRHPEALTRGDVVQLLFQIGGELDVNDVGKLLDQQAIYRPAKLRWLELLLDALDVPPLLDGSDGGCVRAGPANAFLFHGLDQAGLGVARWWLGEVLIGQQPDQIERLALRQRRQRALLFLVTVLPLEIQHGEPGEDHARTVGAEQEVYGLDVHCRLIQLGRSHLASHEAIPDQLVETVLLRRQHRSQLRRVAPCGRWADGFVGLLRPAAAGLVHTRPVGHVGLAPLIPNEVARLALGHAGDVQGVGTHVGDEADRPARPQVHTLVQLLRNGHGALGRKAELAARLLLQRAGGERRRRLTCRAFGAHVVHPVGGALQRFDDTLGVILALGADLLTAALQQLSAEDVLLGPFAGLSQVSLDRPVFLWLELFNRIFAVTDEANCNGLHPAGAQTTPHLTPQQRRQLVTDQPVEHTSRLLGVDQIHVYRARVGDGLLH